MKNNYIGVWAVFEEDWEEGIEKAFRRYQKAGIQHVMYAGIAHAYPVNPAFYKNTRIDPMVQIDYEKNVGDVFGKKKHLLEADFNGIKRLAAGYGLSLEFDITPGVSEAIVKEYPDTAVADVEGNRSPHWLCPSNPDVKAYFYGRTEDILRNNAGIKEVELDVVSIDFYDPQVVPDWVSPELYPLRQLAIGNCFCPHCIKRALQAGLNVQMIKNEISAINKEAKTLTYGSFKNYSDAYRGLFDIVRFILKHPKLIDWLNFRVSLVSDFVSGYYRMVKNINRDILVSNDLVAPSFSWTLGQMYHLQKNFTDITKMMLYHKTIGAYEVKPLRRIAKAIPEIQEDELLRQYYRLKGFSGPDTFDGLCKEGIGVENVYYEVKKARQEVGPSQRLVIGIVADNPAREADVREAVKMAYHGGADGFMLHLWYRSAPKENIAAFGEQLRELNIIR